ncbi:MAG: hypothetical protein ABI520_01945 [Caldimonas sp.]
MKLAAGGFLGGAKSRLLPASIPFRFFGAAVVFHLLAWIAAFGAAADLPTFAGGLGWPLAALHLVTLGVLAMTAIGASLQLLPVATRQPVRRLRGPALIWWLYTPGVAALALGMGTATPSLLVVGALGVAVGLLVFAGLLAANLRGARGMTAIVVHGWGALAALAVLLVTGASLVAAYLGLPLLDRGAAMALHVTFAAYGFMGLLALGLAYLLVPMFALAPAPDARIQLASWGGAVLGLACAGAAAVGVLPVALTIVAIGAGALAVGLHLALMRTALRDGMRRNLGLSFLLVRIGWTGLGLSLVAALGLVLEAPVPGLATLFGLLLVGVWLMSFVLGMLQRILPFLASMHAATGKHRPPTPSSFTRGQPLALHFACHVAGLAALALAIVTASPLLAELATATGAAGATAFAVFFSRLVQRMNAPAAAAPAVPARA